MEQEEELYQMEELEIEEIKAISSRWTEECWVTRRVFLDALGRDKMIIFRKLAALEDQELYKLCQSLKNLLDAAGLNEEWLQWRYNSQNQ